MRCRTLLAVALLLLACLLGVAADDHHEVPAVGWDPTLLGDESIKLTLGEKKRLDSVGPLVINKDGTTKRVTNWDKMTPIEREGAYNRITKRNRERIAVLQKKIKEEEEAKQRRDGESKADGL
eukprot:TRINITY_DN11281_c0_g1_i1.p1 TRINITY_DN11281_c0_g1~~TRINITY_DN11281_c0_g1_i1.p1  ORF type:complete len:123 (+),score=21.59 TRINITY_DN11281_c0_g1_i1:87-455(+)